MRTPCRTNRVCRVSAAGFLSRLPDGEHTCNRGCSETAVVLVYHLRVFGNFRCRDAGKMLHLLPYRLLYPHSIGALLSHVSIHEDYKTSIALEHLS